MGKFWNFDRVLAIISILGFIGIIIQASSDFDPTGIISALLFIIMGFALLSSGGYKLLLKYFKGGITWDELNKIVTIVIGFLSVVLGTLLFFGIDLEQFQGVKIIVAFIAIFVIIIEMWGSK